MRRAWILSLMLPMGCIDLGGTEFPDKQYYSLEVMRAGEAAKPRKGTSLKVRRFRVSARFEGLELVYRQSELKYESDFYSMFFAPPSAILTEQATTWMAGSGLFEHVGASGSYLESTHVLEGTVNSLYGDYRNPDSPKAVLELRFVLIRNEDPPIILHQQSYRQTVAPGGDSVEALVRGWNEGLGKIMVAYEGDLKKLIR